MGEVVDIEDHKPHCMAPDPVTGNAHVFPVSMVKAIAYGETPILDDETMRSLAFMLYEFIKEDGPYG